jgi:hypothetical protein
MISCAVQCHTKGLGSSGFSVHPARAVPFRLAGPSGVLLGAHDIYASRNASTDPEDADLGVYGSTWYDKQAEQIIAGCVEEPLVVEGIDADDLGSIRVLLSRDHVLEIFPATSLADEQWRFFGVGDGPHFLVPAEAED